MTAAVALPYGLRNVQLVPYPTLEATTFGDELVKLPNAQTLSFTEAEEYTELRGDDKLVASHGQGPQIDADLESGGISLDAYQVLNGGTIIEGGGVGEEYRRYRKYVTDQRPYFTAIGQVISDSGGDLHCIIYRARSTGDVAGEFTDGEFFIPGVSITGFGCLVEGLLDGDPIFDALYDFVHHAVITAIGLPAIDTP